MLFSSCLVRAQSRESGAPGEHPEFRSSNTTISSSVQEQHQRYGNIFRRVSKDPDLNPLHPCSNTGNVTGFAQHNAHPLTSMWVDKGFTHKIRQHPTDLLKSLTRPVFHQQNHHGLWFVKPPPLFFMPSDRIPSQEEINRQFLQGYVFADANVSTN